MLHCLRILGPFYSASERAQMARMVDSFVARNECIQCWTADDIARLFFPDDPVRSQQFFEQIEDALAKGDLKEQPTGGFLSSQLVAWPPCPKVPVDSPLRYWLPEFMHEQSQAVGNTTEVSSLRSGDGERGAVHRQRWELMRELCERTGQRMPQDTYQRMPTGIGALAKSLKITRPAFTESVKKHIAGLQEEGEVGPRR